MIAQYVVHIIVSLPTDDAPSTEMTRECETFNEALAAIVAAKASLDRDWRVISILHIEDMPGLLEDAVDAGEVWTA